MALGEPSFESSGITVVIPAKDEEETIGFIAEEARGLAQQLLVVDGHSSDRTVERARECGAELITDNGRGKGDAIRCALAYIRCPITVFIDADGSHDPQDIPLLVAPIVADQFDHVTGSRLIGGSSELHGGFDEFLRLAGSSFITACINVRYGVRLSDSQNGFRAIRTEVLRTLGLKSDITTIEQEMIMRTLSMGYRMGEVPTHEYRRRGGVSKIALTKVWWRYGFNLVQNLTARSQPVGSQGTPRSQPTHH